jgi:putative membrane protein
VREPGVEDATRRTRLANERTYLAWWRTGLTSLAVCVGVGRLVPELSGGTKWPFEVVGALFGVLALAFFWLGYARVRDVEQALDRGGFAPLGLRLPFALMLSGLLLGGLTILVVVVAR